MMKFSLQINQRVGADCHCRIRQFPLSSLLTLQRYYLAKAKSRKRRIVNTIVLAIDAEMRLKRLYIIRYKALLPLPFSVGSDVEWEQIDCEVGAKWHRYGSRVNVKWAQSNFEVDTYCSRFVPFRHCRISLLSPSPMDIIRIMKHPYILQVLFSSFSNYNDEKPPL